MENEKKQYLTRGRMFGYSLWNTKSKPRYILEGIFRNDNYPYTIDEHEQCYIGDDLVKVMFGRDFSLNEGECVEIALIVKG